MINFRKIEIQDKILYNETFSLDESRGCQCAFNTLFMWGTQRIAFLHNHIILFSRFGEYTFYPFPLGSGDKKAVLDEIIKDAKEREISLCLTGLTDADRETLEKLYPNQFYYRADRGFYDYVYDINDLADLKGRKLHRKRNHLKHFKKNHPDYTVIPITQENVHHVRTFVAEWYKLKLEENPDGDYEHEKIALERALSHYDELEMEGLLLEENGEILGFTIASPMSSDTYDVHYEKARGDIDGAYTIINSEFANYLRSKYPHIKYLDREEDMGLPGLRKAKMSYFPHHLIKKWMAIPLHMSFAFGEPDDATLPQLRELWKEAFGDSDVFLDCFYGTAFDKSRCRVAIVHDVDNLAAALYWFDCSLGNQRVAYVYAVATDKQFRGNGACHLLLENTHKHLKSLGYSSVVLVPGNEELVRFYEGTEYELCTKRSRIECAGIDMGIEVQEIGKEEYASLRREFLPTNAIVQENENLDFLATQAKFYVGRLKINSCDETLDNIDISSNGKPHDFLLAANIENSNLYGIELLGDSALAPGIVHALGCKDGTFFTPGKDEPFAMWHALTEDATEPGYLGFAFD